MKRTILCLALLLCLTGCTSVAPSEYLSVTPHTGAGSQSGSGSAVTAENYLSLKNAILGFVKEGQTEGTIHITGYDGDVETDLAEAAYEVSKLDPLGAYAVDYMTHECTLIVSYYEIRIHITFRRTAAEIAAIETVATQAQLETRLQKAVDSYEDRLTLRISNYQDQDIPALAAAYCADNPKTIMETPQVSVSVYPAEGGAVRVVEIGFKYTQPPELLAEKEQAVQESIRAAAEYIRYRQTGLDKCTLLYTYLTERFSYEAGETVTPLYDALCGGVANARGLTQAWQLICDQAGVECYTVSGMRAGEPYSWNIVNTGSEYRHVDLTRCVLETGDLSLWSDREMEGYSWNAELYPVCEEAPEVPVTGQTPDPEPPVEEPPAEEPPVEEAPPVEEELPADEPPPEEPPGDEN